ncbi:MAG: hypothetical protein FJ313_05355, partial [Gemmatimonadetes bacterium]|nr:hypothetical protein [Gemmatimonadota bacterium]
LGRRSAPPFRVSAGLEEKDHLDLVQFGWTRDSASSPAFQLRYGYSVAHLDTAPASPPVAPPVIGLLDGSVVGPPPLGNLAIRTAHNFASTIRPQPLAAARTHHRLGAALSFRQALARNRFSAPFDLHRITFADRPSTLLQLNTPLDSRANVASLLMNASHAARWTGWFSTNVALAADLSRGWLPAQSSPSGAFAPARRFPERRGLISWHSFEPAFSFALTPPTFRRLTLRASLARRHYPLAARYLDYANRNSLSGTEFQWTAAGPGLLLRRFGGQYSSIDPSLRRPYVNQVDLVASCRIPAGLAARLTLFRHDTRNRLAALASGPAYSLRTIHDPGGDFIQGTPDDQLLPVYEQIRDTFGSDRFLLTNTGHGAFSKGLIAELRGRHGSLSWRLSFVAEKAFGITGPGNGPSDNDPGVVGSLLSDPNSLLNAAGRAFFDRAYIAKLSASYQAPARFGRFELGTVVNYFDGLPFARKLFIPDLAQGPFYVLATPRGSPEGGHRTQYHLAWDLRVARSFSLRRGSLRLLADLFNLPNLGNNLRENDLSGPLFEQRLPLAVQPPRHARFAVEYAF